MPFSSNPAAADQESIHVRPILALADLRQSDIALGGGKAANLGELINSGLNVPPGFVLTTAAYSHFVDAADLDKALHAWLTTLAPADGDHLHNAFVNSPMPAELHDAIRNAYRQLGNNVPVAVRSSATAEDLPGATFAGQQETYLNVCGEEALLLAVRNCWASLWTERATLYRSKQNVDQRAVKLAVVVQRMVMAEVAGVLFTADPVTGERDIAVIDANSGLGEAVVAGMVTPDHFVLHKPTLQIRQRMLGAHEVELHPRIDGGVEEIHRHNHSDQPSLSDAQLRELTQLGNRIEQHYGAPQDIEWAWADGQFYILQARPITALPPAVATPPAAPARKARRRPGPDPAELLPIRPYPLDCDTHTRNLLRGVLNSIGGPLGMFIPTLEDVLEIEDGVAVRGKGVAMRPTWRLLYKPWLSLWQRRGTDLRQWASDPIIAEAKQQAQRLETQDFTQLSWLQLLQTMQAALDLENFICQLRQRYFIVAFRDTFLLGLWLGLAGQRKRVAQLTAGMGNITLEINQALEVLATQIRQHPTLKEAFVAEDTASLWQHLQNNGAAPAAWQPLRDAFAAFLAEFGSRETMITLMSQPTWKDAPEVPLGLLKNLVITENTATSPSSAEATWTTARDELLTSTWLGKAPFRNAFVHSLEKARHFVPMRENTHFYLSLPMPSERRAALEMGRRLVESGVLAVAEDVFHLRMAELQRIQDPAQLTAEQRQALAGNVAKRKQRRAELIDQPLFTEPHETPSTVDATALLTGIGGSPGIVEGVVRVILRPQEFDQLQKGEILVAPYTNPAWTPLFLRAAAAIVDTGSTMSHAAIVTREYGIPAVLGTRTATRLLKNGQRVRVDGTKGTVHAV